MLYEILKQQTFTPQHYISGQKALNIYDLKYNTGDWHTVEAWHPQANILHFSLMGEGEKYNTNPYLADRGIIDVTAVLKSMGNPEFAPVVYAASHARAIADMIICNALDGKLKSVTLQDFDDWMSTQEDKERVYALLRIAINNLPKSAAILVKQWLKAAEEKDFDV
jgi:hypothetical protein